MTATLPEDLEEYVKAKVQSGEYPSAVEVIRAGLHLLEDQETLRQIRLERLRKEIAVGIEQADRGEVAPLDVENIIAQGKRLLAQDKSDAAA